eukprot:Partr_v1_DN24859_c0_g1_i1_m29511 putative Essential component of the cytosolic iron-sulfur (Fe S) protein assembly machinery. Required for the maturation of extramitochondrial Fe S proteins (By similarity)
MTKTNATAALTEISTRPSAHRGEQIWQAKWHSGRDILATCSTDRSIRLWSYNGDSGLVLLQELEDVHARTVRSLAFNCDGYLAAASFDSTVSIWYPGREGGNYELVCNLEGHENEVKGVSWSSSGTLLATCSRDKSVWIWMMDEDGEFECISVLQEHSQDVKAVKWHPRDDILISCSYDDTVKIWKEDDEDWYCAQTLSGHRGTVWDVDWSADGSFIVSVGADCAVKFWQLQAGGSFKCVSTLEQVHCKPIYTVSWCPLRNMIATGSGDDKIRLISGETRQLVGEHSATHNGDVNSVHWNSAGTVLASVGDDGAVALWNYR